MQIKSYHLFWFRFHTRIEKLQQTILVWKHILPDSNINVQRLSKQHIVPKSRKYICTSIPNNTQHKFCIKKSGFF